MSEKSVDAYMGGMKKCDITLKNINRNFPGFWNIEKWDDFIKWRDVLYSNEEFKKFNGKKGNNMYSSSLDWYGRFLTARFLFEKALASISEKPALPNVDLTPTILYGPPGTGKTWTLQNKYFKDYEKDNIEFATFHQSYSYEEFVEGLKPVLDESDNISYRIEKGVFYRICEKAAELAGYTSLAASLKEEEASRAEKYGNAIKEGRVALLCIDEINRGNVASIFGDLISLIEPSKRLGAKDELTLTLPYSKIKFGVPANLVIVGTMNTADRSIQLLDSALRRRFRFEEMPPKYDVIKNETAREVLKAINKRIRAILNKDAQIGHAYFVDVVNDVETFKALINKIIPLLEEYFYNDVDKIRFVLNDKNSDKKFYVEDTDAGEALNDYFTQFSDMDSEDKTYYRLNESEFQNLSEADAAIFLNGIIGK